MHVEAALLLPSDEAAALEGRRTPLLAGTATGPLSRRLAGSGDDEPPVRPVATTDLRVSLVELGDVAGPVLPAVRARLAAVAALHGPVQVRLDGLSSERQRTPERGERVAVRVAGDVDALRALHDDVVSAVAPLGLYLDRRTFVPRVVVARAAGPGRTLDAASAALGSYRTASFALDAVALLSRGVDDEGGADAVRLPLGG